MSFSTDQFFQDFNIQEIFNNHLPVIFSQQVD